MINTMIKKNLDEVLNKSWKGLLSYFLWSVLFNAFIFFGTGKTAFSQNLTIPESEYYIDNSKLYNTTLPVEQIISKEAENIKYHVPEAEYIPTQNYYEQNFKARDKISRTPIKTLYAPQDQYKSFIKKKFSKSELRTAGNYLGIDFINTSLQYREIGLATRDSTTLSSHNKTNYNKPNNKNSFGFKYMYAINFKGFFLAPEIFYEYNNIKNSLLPDHPAYMDTRLYEAYGYKYTQIHYRYGAKLNLGYDINPDFAPYIFGGIARIRHSNLSSIYPALERYDIISTINQDPMQIYKKYSQVPFFGFGGKIKLTPHFYLTSEYSIFEFLSKTKSQKFTNYDGIYFNDNMVADQLDIEQNVRIFKLGIMYNF